MAREIGARSPVDGRTVAVVRVTFWKLVEEHCSYWEAVVGKRTRVPGTCMALGRPDGGLPHDLLQLVVEGAVGLDRGFWGSVAAGATFRSTGRKRTRPGRAVIAGNRPEIVASEHVVGEHVRRWTAGEPTPAAAALDEHLARWRDLGDGEGLVVEWPSLALVETVPAGTCPRNGKRRSAGR